MRFHHTVLSRTVHRAMPGWPIRARAAIPCKQRWADDTVGLKARLLQLPALDIWTAFKKIDQSQVVCERGRAARSAGQ